MKPCFVDARDIDDAWHQLLFAVGRDGISYRIDSGSFEGCCRLELAYASGWIRDPHTEKLSPSIPEGLGITPPTDDEAIREYFANYLMMPECAPNEEYKYSQWIHELIDDVVEEDKKTYTISEITVLEWVIRHFREKGHGTNHCYITIGSNDMLQRYDYKSVKGSTPCMRGLDFKIKDGKLIVSVYFRSWDLWGGFPTNIGGVALLNQYVAQELGVLPGPVCFSSAGLHCYDFQLNMLKKRLRVMDKEGLWMTGFRFKY
jgi:thymidylate synthase